MFKLANDARLRALEIALAVAVVAVVAAVAIFGLHALTSSSGARDADFGSAVSHSRVLPGDPGRSGGTGVPSGGGGLGNTGASGSGRRPNIVFVLTDDLSMNLLPFMPHVLDMQRRGLSFSRYFVSDSLCCPSRSSIFTGNFPHDTHVFRNVGGNGGFHVFYNRGEESATFAVALQQAGYRTALMGKYLNGYMSNAGVPPDVGPTYVPPGWNEWDVAGNGYPEFNYVMNENGTLHSYGSDPTDYLTDVLARKGSDFISRSAADGNPFFLELATFAPHDPYVPAPRDAFTFSGLQAPRPPSFDRLPTGAPRWLALHPRLTTGQIQRIDDAFRRRAESVLAVDHMIAQIEARLAALHLADNTYLVFSSDNGLHTGEYRLMPGKETAFDTDIHVPLVVIGPGVVHRRVGYVAENIDLAKTFAQIGGTDLPGDGHTLLGLFHGSQPADWRDAALIEHRGPNLDQIDPDFQQPPAGEPRSYEAMRTRRFLYVEYDDGGREFYDLRDDPFELRNLFGKLRAPLRQRLHQRLLALRECHSSVVCWRAAQLPPGFIP